MNLYTSYYFTTIRNPMDMAISYHLYHKLLKEDNKNNNHPKEKIMNSETINIYQSPKRDMICPQCGQQLHWCVCEKCYKNI